MKTATTVKPKRVLTEEQREQRNARARERYAAMTPEERERRRDLLCGHCNRAIGMHRDTAARILKLALYAEKHKKTPANDNAATTPLVHVGD